MVTLTITATALLSILFGILILIWPKILNYLIGIYLILVGIIQMVGGYLDLSPVL
jgi:uncharacterized membrane protein HdeD (DUF308 family)